VWSCAVVELTAITASRQARDAVVRRSASTIGSQ
jgi:hypothetical protein